MAYQVSTQITLILIFNLAFNHNKSYAIQIQTNPQTQTIIQIQTNPQTQRLHTTIQHTQIHHNPNGAAAPPQSQIQFIPSRSHDSVPRVSPSSRIISDLKSSSPTKSTKPRLTDFTPNSEIPNLFSFFSKIVYSGFRS